MSRHNMNSLLKSRMNMMLTARRVSITTTINRLINFCQKLPFVGKNIPDSLYGEREGKTVVILIANLFRLVKRLMIKSMYIGLLVVGGSYIAQDIGGVENPAFNIDAAMTIFFFLSFLSAPLAFGKALNLDVGTDLMMIDKLRADAGAYVPARIFERKIIDFGASLPFAVILSLHEKYTLIESLAIIPLMIAIKLIFESIILINFSIFRKASRDAYKILSYVYIFLGVLTALAPFILSALGLYFPFKTVVFHPVFIIAALLLSILSMLHIHGYKHYRELAWGTVVNYNLALEKAKPAQKKQLFGNADKWSDDVGQKDLISDKFARLKGYAYFNAVFFHRHKKFFRKKILIRVAITGSALVALSLFLLLNPDQDAANEPVNSYILPICFFFAYMLSLGRSATGAMFANCDSAMLTYPFYRTPSVVIKNFYLRLGKIMQYNAPTFLLLALFAITGDLLAVFYQTRDLAHIDWTQIPLYLITVAMMWLFFSFHDLFIYYIIQPYTSELGTKSKLFSIIQFGVYMLSYMNVFMDEVNTAIYMAVIIALTVLYVSVGLFSINKFCWKTFKLK